MTAAVRERPAPTTGDGGAPARRAMARWAWRLFKREWRQQALVLALLIVAWVERPFMLAQPAASSVTKSALAALPTRKGTSGVCGWREAFLR